jgi:V/A-type H+-transporting ATPase subunit G/H
MVVSVYRGFPPGKWSRRGILERKPGYFDLRALAEENEPSRSLGSKHLQRYTFSSMQRYSVYLIYTRDREAENTAEDASPIEHSLEKISQRGVERGSMRGLGLVKDLAELERDLAQKLEEARRSAERGIKSAEEEAGRIMGEVEAQIRQLTDASEARIAEQEEKLAKEARKRAQEESRRIREQASPNLDRTVDFVLSEVLP